MRDLTQNAKDVTLNRDNIRLSQSIRRSSRRCTRTLLMRMLMCRDIVEEITNSMLFRERSLRQQRVRLSHLSRRLS